MEDGGDRLLYNILRTRKRGAAGLSHQECVNSLNEIQTIMKKKILFICVHNSARSQMAEAFVNHLCGDEWEASSAGLSPGVLNPLAVQVMREAGIDISKNPTKAVFDFVKSGELFTCVVTVCSESESEGCPVFPGITERLHWSFPDPSKLEGNEQEKLAGTREIRDAIRKKIEEWCATACARPCRDS